MGPMSLRASVWLGASLVAMVASAGCSFDWDRYDPRVSAGGSGAAGLSGGGGTGGNGGSGATGGGGTGGTGASGGGGAGNSSPCGSVDLLGDNFDDGVPPLGWHVTLSGNAGIDETGGATLLTLPTDGNGGEILSHTERYYDLRGHRLFVEVPTMVNVATDTGAWFGFAYDENGTQSVDIVQAQGTLWAESSVGGVHTDLAQIAYDPDVHRWWAFREQGGTLHVETSSDGVSFEVLASREVALLFPVDAISPAIGAWDSGTPSPGVARFDNLQGGVAPTEHYCPAPSFSDNFDDNVMPHEWAARAWTDSECSFVEQGGRLVFNHTGAAQVSCGTETAHGYDLTETSATIEVAAVQGSDDPELYAWFELLYDDERAVEFDIAGGVLRCNYYVGGNQITPASTPYDPNQHRWWRISEHAGNIIWEVSPDGTTWTQRHQMPAPIPFDALDVELGVYCNNGCGVASAAFDNYNLPP
jgi:hypothetical protein